MQAPGLTRCLFLSADHRQDRHILNQHSPDIRIEGIPRLSALNQKLDQTSQTLLPTVCCQPLDAKGNNGISCPPYMTSHPPGCWTHVTGLSTTHRTQSRAVHPPSICSSVGPTLGVAPTPLPEFTGIDLRPRKV